MNKRLAVFYVVLAVLAVAATAVIVSAGADKEAQPSVAGGYTLTSDHGCFAREFDLRQSGRFVRVDDAKGTFSGSLEFDDGRLSGDVECVGGREATVEARIADERLEGTVDLGEGEVPLAADRERDPPAAGQQRPRTPSGIAGEYDVVPRSACLGGRLELEEHGGAGELEVVREGTPHGELSYDDGRVAGSVECTQGGEVAVTGEAADRRLTLALAPAEGAGGEGAPQAERVQANKRREFGLLLAAFFLAVAVVMIVARLVGALSVKLGQPRVMGEVVAGIALGPTLFGAVAPDLQAAVFPSDVIPYIGVAANLGLIFYMFLVGLEIDLSQLKGRLGQTAAVSNTGVVIPMIAGLAIALPIYEELAPDTEFLPFALFMGVSMSITAFPVLARILVERRMLRKPVGALALASAAIDDVTAWFLIALATAVAVAGGASDVLQTVALAIAFCLVMGLVVRRLLARVAVTHAEQGRISGAWITAIFAGILLAAYTTEEIGIALIFGAFAMGAVMPRHAGLTEDVTHRLEDFVVIVLLPLFFCYTGLRTNMALLNDPSLLVVTGVLLLVAVACKFGGSMLAARITGMGWRDSAVIGALMNTRGLTELIVLNLALEKGVISEALFAALVIMALVTTFMAGPLLRLLDPRNELGEPVEEELERARRESLLDLPKDLVPPERAVLVAPQTDAALPQLLAISEPLAAAQPPRELVLARLLEPTRAEEARGGLQTERRRVRLADQELQEARLGLVDAGLAARSLAFVSADPGQDLVELSRVEDVDLVLVDGSRPMMGDGVPRGDVGTVLAKAPSDVAVLVAGEDAVIAPGPDRPVVVPFGGAEHDWAALELGSWLASATGAGLRLVSAPRGDGEGGDPANVLASTRLIIQQFAGIDAETVVADEAAGGIVGVAGDAGLVIVGLSERWRSEGLGPVRSDLARCLETPVVFVRRGLRPGALAPRDSMQQFGWSTADIGLRRTSIAVRASARSAEAERRRRATPAG